MTEREYKRFSILLFAAFLSLAGYVFLTFDNSYTIPDIGKPVMIRWKNKSGDSVTSLKGSAQQFAAREKRIIDSLAEVYGTREKYLLEYITAITKTETDIQPDPGPVEKDYEPVTKADCPPAVKNMRKTFSNPYYDIQAQIGDSNYLHLKSFDTLTVLWKRGKEGSIFNRKRFLQADISFANPYNRISKMDAYRVAEKKPKKWGVGLQAGYGFSGPGKPVIYAGVGISFNFIRL